MKKVSFDFDDCLDRTDIQQLARLLIDNGFDLWITTSRPNDADAINPNSNDDIKKVCQDLSIPLDQVIFCNNLPKYQFLKNTDFILHIDDQRDDCEKIKQHTKTKSVMCRCNIGWVNQVKRILSL